jgi:hypothetical protein
VGPILGVLGGDENGVMQDVVDYRRDDRSPPSIRPQQDKGGGANGIAFEHRYRRR